MTTNEMVEMEEEAVTGAMVKPVHTIVTITPDTQIESVFSENKLVRKLVLSTFTSVGLMQVIESLTSLVDSERWESLSAIVIDNCELDRPSVESLATFMLYLPSLNEFEIKNSDWSIPVHLRTALGGRFRSDDPVLARACDEYLSLCPPYEAQAFWSLFKGANPLAQSLKKFKKISITDSNMGLVHRPNTGGEPISFFYMVMAALTDSVETLDFSNNNFWDSHVVFSRPILGPGAPENLKKLNLSRNRLTDLGLIGLLTGDTQFAEPLVSFPEKRNLQIDLSGNRITLASEQAREILKKFILENLGVEIELSGNPICCDIGLERVVVNGEMVLDPQDGKEESSSDDSDYVDAENEDSSDSSISETESEDGLSLVSEESDLLHLLDE